MTNRLESSWKLDGFVDEQRYYCSETPIDTANLPSPKAVLAGDVRTYVDTNIESGKTYYVRVGSVRNGVEKLSAEIVVSTATHPVLSLFSNAEKGLWLDFKDMSSLYQDSAGTIPVTAQAQPFGLILDKSGNGNHAAQTTNSNRPEFRSNGAYFDGNNRFLKTIGNIDYGGSNNVEIFLKIESLYSSNKAYFFVIESGSTFNEKAGSFVSLAREASDSITAGYSISTNSSQNVTHAHRGNGATYNGIYSLSVTNTEFILDVINDATTYSKPKPSGIPVANNFLMIGGRQNRSDFGFYGYIKQIVCVNRILTAAERSNLIAFLDAN